VYDLEFIDAVNGNVIGTADRERGLPVEGSEVVLEHAILGPVTYRVTRPPSLWYRARRGNLAKPDQYTGTSVKVYVQRIGGPR
jgi:hypothetical protein